LGAGFVLRSFYLGISYFGILSLLFLLVIGDWRLKMDQEVLDLVGLLNIVPVNENDYISTVKYDNFGAAARFELDFARPPRGYISQISELPSAQAPVLELRKSNPIYASFEPLIGGVRWNEFLDEMVMSARPAS
jgi:hypothetical protein